MQRTGHRRSRRGGGGCSTDGEPSRTRCFSSTARCVCTATESQWLGYKLARQERDEGQYDLATNERRQKRSRHLTLSLKRGEGDCAQQEDAAAESRIQDGGDDSKEADEEPHTSTRCAIGHQVYTKRGVYKARSITKRRKPRVSATEDFPPI